MTDKSDKPVEESAKPADTLQSDKKTPGKDIAEPAKVDSAESKPGKNNKKPTGEKPAEDKPVKKEPEETSPESRRKFPWFGLFNFISLPVTKKSTGQNPEHKTFCARQTWLKSSA